MEEKEWVLAAETKGRTRTKLERMEAEGRIMFSKSDGRGSGWWEEGGK